MDNSRLQHIDVWRCFAIALVLVCHILGHSHPWYKEALPQLVSWFQPNGTVGVQIFFCISGFVICRGLVRETDTFGRISIRGFFIRRAYRILPPLMVFIAGVAVFTALGFFELRPSQFARAALFLCNIQPLGGCGWALGHTWSLAFEEQFYLIFPLLVVALGLIRKPYRLLCILACLISFFLLSLSWEGSRFLQFYLSNFIYMLAGCACALYWKELQPLLHRLPSTAWLLIVLVVVGVNGIALPTVVKTHVYPVVFPLLICIAVFGTPLHRPVVQFIFLHPVLAHFGRISYGIYLWQQLATYDYGFHSPVSGLILVPVALALAHYSYKHFELPLIKLGTKAASKTVTGHAVLSKNRANNPRQEA